MNQEQEHFLQRQKVRTQEAQSSQAETRNESQCPKCGAVNPTGAMFCEECGSPLSAETCLHCGATILPGADVCEHCGTFIGKERCGFCGEKMNEDDAFCPECGSPRAGIKCPNCGTHNHSAFCIKCYTPLTQAARDEIQKAQKDPAFQQVLTISDEINRLEQQLKQKVQNPPPPHTEPEKLTPPPAKTARQLERERKNQELKRMYLELTKGAKIPPRPSAPGPEPEIPEVQPVKHKQEENELTQEEIANIIRQKREEMQKLLDSMKPDNSTSPQMVRNYYTARKPPVSDSVWECNFNHSLHPNPTHCGKPFMGGKWVVEYRKIQWEVHHGEC